MNNDSNINSSEDSIDIKDNIQTCKEQIVQVNIVTPCRCDECSIIYDSFASYQVHSEMKHDDLIKFNTCGQISACVATLTNCIKSKMKVKSDEDTSGVIEMHKEVITVNEINLPKDPFICICGKSFEDSMALETHEVVHIKEKPYTCDVCNSQFTTRNYLKRHKLMHTGKKPNKCNICSLGFTSSSIFKQHEKLHTGEKPYKCDVCTSSFTSDSNLKQHTLIHTGEKPFNCDICSSAFTTSSTLKSHKRVHSGEKLYKCDVCNSSFSVSSTLKNHKRTHHTLVRSHISVSTAASSSARHRCSRII